MMAAVSRNVLNKILLCGNLCQCYIFWEVLKFLRSVSLLHLQSVLIVFWGKEITNN